MAFWIKSKGAILDSISRHVLIARIERKEHIALNVNISSSN